MSNNWTTEQLSALFDIPSQFLLQDSNKDMIAINRYMSDTVAITPEAVKLKDDWIRWYDNLTWNEKNILTRTFDEARNRRNAFFIANAPTEEAKEEIRDTLRNSITTEEAEGNPRRALSDGSFPEPPPPPLVPTWVKTGGVIAILVGVAAGVATIVTRFNPASIVARTFTSKKG